MSQALLRAARMGQVNRPTPPPLEDEKEPGEDEDAEGDIDTGFVTLRWAQVPKHMEGPEPEFLAKRRKGLHSAYGGIMGPLGESGQMRKTKIRKVDVEGNTYVYDVLAPEGQAVEGEIIEDENQGTIQTEAPAPGTVLEGVGIVNAEGIVIAGDQVMPTPPRRRPPPPKRKAKGPGRGRRKKAMLAAGVAGSTGNLGGVALSSEAGMTGTEGTKKQHTNLEGPIRGDVEMADDSMLQEGEEGTDDEEEGEEGDDGDREEGELSPSPDADAPGSISGSPSKQPTKVEESRKITRDISSSPDLPLAAGQGFQAPSIEVELAEDTVLVPTPSTHQITTDDRIVTEEPPAANIEPAVATLPANHEPLNGLAEPQFPADARSSQAERFPDGEEDLLGSLERHLNKDGPI